MKRGSVWVMAIGTMLVARSARPEDCDGSSYGFDQCQAHPNCECTYQIVTCSNGGWYTQYSVTSQCSAGWGTGSGSSAGSGSGGDGSGDNCSPAARAKRAVPKPGVVVRTASVCSNECNLMQRWLGQQQSIVNAYQDQSLLDWATAQHLSSGQYDIEVWREVNNGDVPPQTGIAAMSTNPKTCQVSNYATGCQGLLDLGLPQAACQIAYDHELTHVGQCGASNGSYDRYDLASKSAREVEAYRQSISDLQSWIQSNCSSQ